LEKRDGSLSGASVTIYRSTEIDCPNSILNAKTRVQFEQEIPTDQKARENFGIEEEEQLMADDERGKEIMVIVKRGQGVDYEERKGSPLIKDDIREDHAEMTWKEIRAARIDYLRDNNGDKLFGGDEYEPDVEIDAYEHVDTFVWPPLHFSISNA
jgi:hypothetical protein